MKKAFYPGMAGLGRMRPAKDGARTVSSRAADQNTWQGLLSFRDSESGGDTIFATKDDPQEDPQKEAQQAQEPLVRRDHYPNVNYYGPAGGESRKDFS